MTGKQHWWALKSAVGILALVTAIIGPAVVNAEPADTKPLYVVTTIRPLALLVQDVAGDAAEVQVLVSGGASPHSYSLRVSDMQQIGAADLLVWLGPEFERFLARTIVQRDPQQHLALGDIELHQTEAAENGSSHLRNDHGHEGRDMHLWLNPAHGAAMLTAIAERLSELYPQAAPEFATNLARAKAEVADASADVADRLAPLADGGFGVSHDAFRLFAEFFNLKQVGAISAMPDQAVSARHIKDTKDKLEGARCLIVEANEPPATIQRFERLFKLPAVKADPLALDPELDSYAEFIRQLGEQFRKCLEA